MFYVTNTMWKDVAEEDTEKKKRDSQYFFSRQYKMEYQM
jgi:hypothetical protein